MLPVIFDGLHAERGGEMSLAGARATDEYDIIGGLDEVTVLISTEI